MSFVFSPGVSGGKTPKKLATAIRLFLQPGSTGKTPCIFLLLKMQRSPTSGWNLVPGWDV
jgi:hypothetical protein